jgi:glutamate racemase
MSDARPIGVFDSGVGGLTVVRAIVDLLPNEPIRYLGDNGRFPYGPRGVDEIRRFGLELADALVRQDVKMLVVACNSIEVAAIEDVAAAHGVPVVGVVEPGARAAVRASRTGHIGVIATNGTIKSGAYVRAIHAEAPDAHVTALACPLFVPLVEEGWTQHEATRSIAREYLAPFMGDEVDTLVLGCTHYPLLKPLIADIVGPGVRLIDSAEETAADTRRMLAEHSLAAERGDASYRFVASDDQQQFLTLGQRFFGDTIEHVEIKTFG